MLCLVERAAPITETRLGRAEALRYFAAPVGDALEAATSKLLESTGDFGLSYGETAWQLASIFSVSSRATLLSLWFRAIISRTSRHVAVCAPTQTCTYQSARASSVSIIDPSSRTRAS